jgi:hypothetical protein
MYKLVTVPYGHAKKELRIPERNLAWISGPKDAPPVENLPEANYPATSRTYGA